MCAMDDSFASSVPKPLVPINGVPLLTRWLRLLMAAGVSLADVFVVGNAYNHAMLQACAAQSGLPPANVVSDGSTSNDTRVGAVRDIDLLLSSQPSLSLDAAADANAWSGLLVIGGDTLFYPEFSAAAVLERFRAAPTRSQLLYYEVTDPRRHGIIEVDGGGCVRAFLEKPGGDETASRKACPCFYVLSRPALARVRPYVAAAASLDEVDAPGNLLRHLIQLNGAAVATTGDSSAGAATAPSPPLAIEAHPVAGRFDIGGLDTYVQCDQWFRQFEEKGTIGESSRS